MRNPPKGFTAAAIEDALTLAINCAMPGMHRARSKVPPVVAGYCTGQPIGKGRKCGPVA